MATKKTGTKNATAKGSSKKGMSTTQKAELGAGVLAAVGAAAAGYYFYGAKSAEKHRNATAKWAKGLKNDVVREAKKLKDLDEVAMKAIVDKAAQAYKGLDDVTPGDLRAAVAELKSNFDSVRKEIKSTGSKAKTAATKTVKKAAPKKVAAKKAPAKKTPAKKTSR